MEPERKKTTGEPGNPGEFGHKTQTEDAIELDEWEWGDYLPTKREVDEARERMIALQPSRPLYRGDWERINGGTGPTLAQHRTYEAERGRERNEWAQARAEYERMFAAWSASDKSQDEEDTMVRCENCGAWFDEYDGKCMECGWS